MVKIDKRDSFFIRPAKMNYTIRFYVNSEMTCTLENVPLEKVYDFAVPSEAFQDIPGNRWNTLTRGMAEFYMDSIEEGEMIRIAYQDPPSNPELDRESIFVEARR